MTIATGTFTTFSAKGIREDLTEVIWNVSPTETPFVTSIQRAKASATLHEWQTDALAAADNTNYQLEGDDITSYDAVTASVRLTNDCQISQKTLVVSRTEEKALKAGRKSEVAYQLVKKGKELRRDIEYILAGTNQAKAAGNASTARKVAGLLSWIKTNTSIGTGSAANPSAADGTGTRTDGTTRTFTEASLKAVNKLIFDNASDEPDLLLVPSAQKQVVSGFTGNATRTVDADQKKLIATIDYYVHDYGTLRVVADRFIRSTDVFVLNTDMWALAWFDPIHMEDLAKTGDATKKLLICEYTLESRNEKGSGGVFDIA